jgi:peptidoglycan hydrolase CwlO-like protein
MSNADLAKTKRFLNNLLPDVEAAHLELQIKDQETSLDNAEKKLRTLQAERQELDTKLADNLKTQDETAKEIESRKLSLETLRGKRKKD